MTDSTFNVPAPSFADRLVDHGVEDGIGWITATTAPLYGAVNGYVHVPEGHPWRGLGYDEIDVRVNGGLTYGGGEWFGFDTLHAGDWWPGMQHDPDEGDTRWTPELVSEETRNLARQAAEAAKRPTVSAEAVTSTRMTASIGKCSNTLCTNEAHAGAFTVVQLPTGKNIGSGTGVLSIILCQPCASALEEAVR